MGKMSIDIEGVIKNKSIISHYQPIVSVLKGEIVGFEALSRGRCLDNKDHIISPNQLFLEAHRMSRAVELDRLCRDLSLKCYCEFYRYNEAVIGQSLLFVNIDISIIDKGIVGSGYLAQSVSSLALKPQNIVLEILESQVQDIEALKRFVTIHREKGFLIALDDVGSGYSNLDRIPMLKPDIIKIDKGLIDGLDGEFYKQEVFRSLSRLAKKLGSLVVAEGIETLEQAIAALELGADMLQGYYFSRPQEDIKELYLPTTMQIEQTGEAFRKAMMKKLRSKRIEYETYDFIVTQVIDGLESTDEDKFDDILREFTQVFLNLECMYILNAQGVQVSSTIFAEQRITEHHNHVYKAALKGTDHSIKRYYLALSTGQNKYITDSYVSLASGNLCVTISTGFTGLKAEKYILCVDLYPQRYT
ncbi:hypothetical protein BHF68_11640 [Desulfuribacillus alkaliarsenatis]|uniref:EAL domain-containing protein n=2 Tax=Desulfuribacillus alkaliarsenatis TaxID=766136 RepID=A0A1E5FYZ9_9FIRM|nr:hypothetical protein BHF68_11640 [Desulfuribacillus alkaliarsenatis]